MGFLRKFIRNFIPNRNYTSFEIQKIRSSKFTVIRRKKTTSSLCKALSSISFFIAALVEFHLYSRSLFVFAFFMYPSADRPVLNIYSFHISTRYIHSAFLKLQSGSAPDSPNRQTIRYESSIWNLESRRICRVPFSIHSKSLLKSSLPALFVLPY